MAELNRIQRLNKKHDEKQEHLFLGLSPKEKELLTRNRCFNKKSISWGEKAQQVR